MLIQKSILLGEPFMISIVVVTYNRKKLLKQCLESVINQNFIDTYETIVIDNGSSDGTEEFVKNEYNNNVTIITNNRKKSLAACKYFGTQKANGDIVAFIDDDCYASNNWLTAIKESLLKYDFVGGMVLPIPNMKFPRWWRYSLDWLIGIAQKPNRTFLPIGSNVAFKKCVLDALPLGANHMGVDENQLHPDLEDNYRVKKALNLGFSMIINPQMIIYHHVPKYRLKIKYLMKRSYEEGGTWVLCEKKFRIFIYCLIAAVLDPIRYLISWDSNRFFRMIVHVSYVYNYFKSILLPHKFI